jgi:hypothetical protein
VSLVHSSADHGRDRGTRVATTIAFTLIGLATGVAVGWVRAPIAYANTEGYESEFRVFATRMLAGGIVGAVLATAVGSWIAASRPFVSVRRLESGTAISLLVIGFAVAIFLTSGCNRYVRIPPSAGVRIDTYWCAAPDTRTGLRLAIAGGAALLAVPLLLLARRRAWSAPLASLGPPT